MSTFLSLGQDDGGGGGIVMLIQLALLAICIAGVWKTFAKAGQPGWAAIIPVFNAYVMLKVVNRPWWWLILFFIPVVNLIMYIIVMLDLAKAFGKSIGFAIGLILLCPIFVCILGFGNAQYVGRPA
jgi:hypothetical protein